MSSNPLEQFCRWQQRAIDASLPEPNAMTLATASLDGQPSCRTLLLKQIDDHSLVFYTSYKSRKSRELEDNPRAMVTFLWKEHEQQVSIEGSVAKVSREASEAYFLTRPRGARISCWAAEQGATLASREELERAYGAAEKFYEGSEVPLPDSWGGWRLTPTRFEFWQGRRNRLHDRFQYTQHDGIWIIDRLAP